MRGMFLPVIFRRQPHWLVLIEAMILVGLIGGLDYVTSWEWSLFAPYALPIVLVTWKTGRLPGFVFAVLCAGTYGMVNMASNPYQTHWGFAMAVATGCFYFAILVVAVAALKTQQKLDRERIATLERAQELERQILRASEREQQRIGRDLHDSLGPHLAAIRYAATFLADDLHQRDQPEAMKAKEICVLVGEAVSHARDLARGIFPMQLDGAGLSMALEDLARIASSQTGMTVSFYETGDTQVANQENAMHLYRIVQEAVNNAAKHSEARTVTIALNTDESSLRLTVSDDGKGMLLTPGHARGMGLHSMSYRANSIGGELKIDSMPGEGMIVSCEILHEFPLQPVASS